MVLSRLPALVSCFGSISWEGRKDRKPPWKSKKVGSKGLAVPLSISLLPNNCNTKEIQIIKEINAKIS